MEDATDINDVSEQGIGTINLGGITSTIYSDAPYQDWSATGYTTVTGNAFTPVGPISIDQYDRDGNQVGQATMSLAWVYPNGPGTSPQYAIPSAVYRA